MILTLVNGGAIVDYRTVEGATALHKAVERNNFEALKTLLGKWPEPEESRGELRSLRVGWAVCCVGW